MGCLAGIGCKQSAEPISKRCDVSIIIGKTAANGLTAPRLPLKGRCTLLYAGLTGNPEEEPLQGSINAAGYRVPGTRDPTFCDLENVEVKG